MALQEYLRPQKHKSWFNVSPIANLRDQGEQRIAFLDSFVVVSPCSEAPGFRVSYEGREELCVESHYGFLCVWFGDDLKTPAWEFPTLFERDYPTDFVISPPRVFRDTNLLDLIENNGDVIHFKTVHRWLSVKLTDHYYDDKVFRLKMGGRIQYARSADSPFKRRLAEHMPVWEYSQDLAFHGPGFGSGQIDTDQGIRAQVILAFTPVGEHDLKLHIAGNVDPESLPKPLRALREVGVGTRVHQAISWGIAKAGLDDTDGDYRIWRYKRSLRDPKLLPNEGDILRIREWMSQYYLPDFKQPSDDAEASIKPEATWTFLAHAQEVLPNRVNTFAVAGEELIAYHTQDGQLRVFEAHCPHQGAHLGRGGKLNDDCVGCPFHEFYFDADGAFRGQSPSGKPKAHMRLRAVVHRQAGQRVEVLV